MALSLTLTPVQTGQQDGLHHDEMLAYEFDIHYIIDSRGSREEYRK